MELRKRAMTIPAPCVYWQRNEAFNEVEELIWERVAKSRRILDFGSGDQSLRRKFSRAGYSGSYETYDASPEFETTYRNLEDVRGQFDAVLCLEVLEHMPLEAGLALRERLLSWVGPGGWLVISTPNPACILSPFNGDETHVHLYPLHDLLTWALDSGLEPYAWRYKLLPDHPTVLQHVRLFTQRVLCYLIGADRADGLVVMGRKPPQS